MTVVEGICLLSTDILSRYIVLGSLFGGYVREKAESVLESGFAVWEADIGVA